MSEKIPHISEEDFSNTIEELFQLFIKQDTITNAINDSWLFRNELIPSNEKDEFLGLCRDSIIFKWYLNTFTDYCPHFIDLACPYLLKYPLKNTRIYSVADTSICKDCHFLHSKHVFNSQNFNEKKHLFSHLSPALSSLYDKSAKLKFTLDDSSTDWIKTELNFLPIYSAYAKPISLNNIKKLMEYPIETYDSFKNLFLNTQYDYIIPVSLLSCAYKHCKKTCSSQNTFPISYWDDYYIFSTLASLPSPALKNYMASKISNYITQNEIHNLSNTPVPIAPICLGHYQHIQTENVFDLYNYLNTPEPLIENPSYEHKIRTLLSTDWSVLELYDTLKEFITVLNLVTFSYHTEISQNITPERYNYFSCHHEYSSIEELENTIYNTFFSSIKQNLTAYNAYLSSDIPKLKNTNLSSLFEAYIMKKCKLENYTYSFETNDRNYKKIRYLLPSIIQILLCYGQFPSSIYGSPFISNIVYRKNDITKP